MYDARGIFVFGSSYAPEEKFDSENSLQRQLKYISQVYGVSCDALGQGLRVCSSQCCCRKNEKTP